MGLIYHGKVGRTFTFMKDLASVVTLSFLLKFLLQVSGIKFSETYRAGGKSVKGDYLQKYLLIFIFIYNFVKIITVILLL